MPKERRKYTPSHEDMHTAIFHIGSKASDKKFKVTFPYNSQVVVEVKYKIDKTMRTWIPKTKQWEFDKSVLDQVRAIADSFYDNVSIEKGD